MSPSRLTLDPALAPQLAAIVLAQVPPGTVLSLTEIEQGVADLANQLLPQITEHVVAAQISEAEKKGHRRTVPAGTPSGGGGSGRGRSSRSRAR